jgi:hypothetical protein
MRKRFVAITGILGAAFALQWIYGEELGKWIYVFDTAAIAAIIGFLLWSQSNE